MQAPDPSTQVTREVVETVARIMGDGSAAARALRDADTHQGEVRFYKLPGTFVVGKLSPPK
jgi:hypothetical protein